MIAMLFVPINNVMCTSMHKMKSFVLALFSKFFFCIEQLNVFCSDKWYDIEKSCRLNDKKSSVFIVQICSTVYLKCGISTCKFSVWKSQEILLAFTIHNHKLFFLIPFAIKST